MLKGIEKNFQENYSHIINSKRKDQLKTKEDVPVTEAFELYMLKNFHEIKLSPLTTKILNFWEHDFDQSVGKHKKFLQDNLEDQNNYSSRFSQILNEMDIFQNDENDEKREENQDQGQDNPQTMIRIKIPKTIETKTMRMKHKLLWMQTIMLMNLILMNNFQMLNLMNKAQSK
jgi:cobalamin biosynthesis protein CobT